MAGEAREVELGRGKELGEGERMLGLETEVGEMG
jgi:hypothetical protein